jgi:putative transcriptional regulator
MTRHGLVVVIYTERTYEPMTTKSGHGGGSFLPERPTAMNKHATRGKRHLKDDIWHDDDGPIPGVTGSWDPPMTEAEQHEAAMSDPDNRPHLSGHASDARPIAAIKRLRWSMGLSPAEFARRFAIPLETLEDWEHHRAEPDQMARAYLEVIRRMPDEVMAVLATASTQAHASGPRPHDGRP